MPSKEILKTFLLAHYRNSRFHDRDTGFWYDYQDLVTDSHMDRLKKYGMSNISHHDTKNGLALTFDTDLNVMYLDYVETPRQSQTLSHLF